MLTSNGVGEARNALFAAAKGGTLNGEGLSETQLRDIAQNVIRNQLAGVPEPGAFQQPSEGHAEHEREAKRRHRAHDHNRLARGAAA